MPPLTFKGKMYAIGGAVTVMIIAWTATRVLSRYGFSSMGFRHLWREVIVFILCYCSYMLGVYIVPAKAE